MMTNPSFTQKLLLFQLSLSEKEEAKSALKSWVAGFSRNSGGNPYLLDETLRVALFPGAPVTAVVSSQQARPILQRIKNTVATLGEGLQVLDINLEEMEDLEGREDQVSGTDPLALPHTSDQENSVLGSEISNVDTSFSGFTEASASGHEQVPQQQAKAAHSLQKKMQQVPKKSERLKVFERTEKGTEKWLKTICKT